MITIDAHGWQVLTVALVPLALIFAGIGIGAAIRDWQWNKGIERVLALVDDDDRVPLHDVLRAIRPHRSSRTVREAREVPGE